MPQGLARLNVKMIALRCAGFNNVALEMAEAFDISTARVPAYSPYAVAEHASALLMTLNRKTHKVRGASHGFKKNMPFFLF